MKENINNIRHLRAFIAVVECQGISKATERVYLSQPAITQAISKLEESLGTMLFERKSTGMYPTESGEVLAGRVQRALGMLTEGLKEALKFAPEEQTSTPASVLNLITTTQLKALIAITAANSFSSAGRDIGISQSSLHRSGRDLENLLGVPLFEKNSLGISPTRAALVLTRAAKLAFAEISQAREEIQSLHHIETGLMRVGSMPLARTSILPGSIIEFTSQYPDFQFNIMDGPYDDLLSHLRFGDIDILIGALRFPAPKDDIIQEELFSSGVVIVARPDHPCVKKEQLDLQQLSQESWVVPRAGAPTRTIFNSLFEEAGLAPPERLVESNSHILIRSLLWDSNRMTLISTHQIQHELESGLLAVVPYPVRDISRPIGITTRKEWQPTSRQQHFLEILRKNGTQYEPEPE